MDEILIANECVEEMKAKGKKGIVCKVELEKAYNYVSRDFLEYVLNHMCFSVRWRNWINGYV